SAAAAVAQQDEVVALRVIHDPPHRDQRHEHRADVQEGKGCVGVDVRVQHLPDGDIGQVAVDVKLQTVACAGVQPVGQALADVTLVRSQVGDLDGGPRAGVQPAPYPVEVAGDSKDGDVLGGRQRCR